MFVRKYEMSLNGGSITVRRGYNNSLFAIELSNDNHDTVAYLDGVSREYLLNIINMLDIAMHEEQEEDLKKIKTEIQKTKGQK